LKPDPDVAVILKLVVPSCEVAFVSASTAAGSAALTEADADPVAGADAGAEAEPDGEVESQPASASAAVAIVAIPSPASRGVRMSVPSARPARRWAGSVTPVNSRWPGKANGHDGQPDRH
jgi:hypothetical protein